MTKKKFLLIIILGALLLGIGWLAEKKALIKEKKEEVKRERIEREKSGQVNLVLDFGEGEMATFSGIRAKTAFEALEIVAQKENFEIETKEYDFGVLVQAIQGKENTQDQAWLYYVNSQMADKAADKFELKDQDQVLWKYEKPKF